jgi:hypothetical protein
MEANVTSKAVGFTITSRPDSADPMFFLP